MGFKKALLKLKPTIPKKWLLLSAGVIWSGVGILLLTYAVNWLTRPFSAITALLGLLGLIISIAADRFQFSKLARKNIERILSLNDKACLFAFQAWKGYLIIAVMMTGGILLRSSSFPKSYLAIVYAAMGGALFQASFQYYASFFQLYRSSSPQLDAEV
ncbi:MAG: hypothetical protein IT308_03315 [Anaerolineaceae bacterium]|nr:hypothetical protein [Anaerolineaceae bacterium]